MSHQIAVAELLPFYVNGTLDDGDRARVEAELETCARCAQDVHELRRLSDALRTHAVVASPLSPRVLPRTLDRLGPMQPAFAPVELRRSLPAWWSIPLSYVASLMLIFGGGAVAAGIHAFGDGGTHTASGGIGTTPHHVTLQATPQPNAPRPGERIVVGDAALRLSVPDDVAAYRRARAIIAHAGGTLQHPTAHARPHTTPLQIDALLPPSRLQPTLAQLTSLGRVVARQTTSRTVTVERDDRSRISLRFVSVRDTPPR